MTVLVYADFYIDSVILTETARLEREFPMQKIEAVQFEDFFDSRLQRYDEDRIMLSDEREEQEQISIQVQEANAAFVDSRRGDHSTREREQALQRLENAYIKYKEILGNLETGRKFYNDLANIVDRFRNECREFRYQRRMEAAQFETSVFCFGFSLFLVFFLSFFLLWKLILRGF